MVQTWQNNFPSYFFTFAIQEYNIATLRMILQKSKHLPWPVPRGILLAGPAGLLSGEAGDRPPLTGPSAARPMLSGSSPQLRICLAGAGCQQEQCVPELVPKRGGQRAPASVKQDCVVPLPKALPWLPSRSEGVWMSRGLRPSLLTSPFLSSRLSSHCHVPAT